MKAIIGIDLGVQSVQVANISHSGKPTLLLNHEGQHSTSSAILFADENIIVGGYAKELAGIEENAFAEFLRDIGRGITHKTPHGTFSPSDLCALLLRPLIDHVRNDYGEVSAVAIAIPHNLRDDARLEILRAATLVGIYKPNLINDNTAEALFLRNTHKLKKGKYLLVNLRAGTADATVFEVAGDSLRVVHVSGVGQLGLNDLKHSMMGIVSDKIAQKVGKKVSDSELSMDYCFSIHSTDRLIEQLCVNNRAEQSVWCTTQGRISIEVTRREFVEKIASHTQQLEYLIESTLDKAGVSPRNLTGCFLSTSKIDLSFWADCISSKLGMQPLSTPQGSIAKGAALYAATKSREEDLPLMAWDELKSINVQELAPYYVGILEVDWLTQTKRNRIIISKGEILPCKRTFELLADDLGRIPEIKVTTAYTAEENADSLTLLQPVQPTRTKANSKHILTISMNEGGQTFVNISIDDKDRDSSYFTDSQPG